MPNRRKSLKSIREITRYHYENQMSHRRIAKALGISRPTVKEYILKLEASGLSCPELLALSDSAFNEIIKPKSELPQKTGRLEELTAKFPEYSKELLRTGVNLKVLWDEYKKKYPVGYQYAQFCLHYSNWRGSGEISMHMEYKAGDKLFVDFTGKKLQLTDRVTREKQDVEVFVGILGASQYTYVEAVENQKKGNFIRACENALSFIQGVPNALVPDCLKSAVTNGNKYEPQINPEYADFARHYGTCILPARPHEPRDKAHVENAVKIVYSWIFALLRNREFYSLDELNRAIRDELENYNSRKMQKRQVSRKELFLEIEQKELKALPQEKYSSKKFAAVTIAINYHVYLKEDQHYYSVPCRYRGKKADLIYTERNVEIFHENIRIATHQRNPRNHAYTTVKEHMPASHQWISEWNPERFLKWGKNLGPNVENVMQKILQSSEHPEQGYKVCVGILNLGKKDGKERLDKACGRALYFQHYSYRGIKSILDNKLEDMQEEELIQKLPVHENIRGSDYFH